MDSKSLAKLRRIQAAMPEDLKGALEQKKPMSAVHFVLQEALKDPNIAEDKKVKYREMLASGQFDQTEISFDNEKYEQAMQWLDTKIKKAIEDGDLPHPDEDATAKDIISRASSNVNKA